MCINTQHIAVEERSGTQPELARNSNRKGFATSAARVFDSASLQHGAD